MTCRRPRRASLVGTLYDPSAMPCRLSLLTSLVAVALTGCAALFGQGEPQDVFVIALSPEETGLFEQRVRVDVRVLNPNQFDLHVTGLDFKLGLNGTRFARGLSSQDVTIPRLGEGKLSVVASATTMSLLKQLLAMGKGQALTL